MRKIAFFSMAPPPRAPLANGRVAEVLAAAFPEHEVDVIYVRDLLRRRPAAQAAGVLATLAEYGPDLVARRKRLRDCYLRTPYIFRTIKRLAADRLRGGDYAFSFQMQSLFDAGVPGLPHFVYTDHTHLANLGYPGVDARSLFSQRWIELEGTIYRNAALVMTRSSHVSRSLVEQYQCPPERIACVYAGSNAAVDDDPATGVAAGGDPAAKSILFVGTKWERKGGPCLVEAFRAVRRKHPEARLVIVGCTPRIGSVPGCEVVGPVPVAEVDRYFRAASVFCMPTRREPFGIVFVEALAHGLPIVATAVGAVPDMVADGRNGFLVEPGDAAALAGRLCRLLDDPELCRSFGAAGRALARDRYNWQAVGRRLREHILAATGAEPAEREAV